MCWSIPLFKRSRISLLLSLAFVVALFPHGGSIAQAEDTGVALPRPEFRNPRAETSFDNAMSHYKKKEFDKARSAFKKAGSGTKDKQSKAVVNRWIKASDGAKKLSKLRARARSKPVDSYFRGMEAVKSFRDTPIFSDFRAFLDELSEQAFYKIDDFDIPSKAYSVKYGKKWIKDPKIVQLGLGCIHWKQTKDFKGYQLKFKEIPQSFTPYFAVSFWVKVQKPAKMSLVAETQGEGKDQFDAVTGRKFRQKPAFRREFTLRKSRKWVRVQFPLGAFEPFADPDWKSVTKLYLATAPKAQFDLYLDQVQLVRKDKKLKKAARVKGGKKAFRP